MTVKEKIIAEIEKIPEQKLPELFKKIKDFEESELKPNLMEQLRKIKISASPDFSTTSTLYPIVEKDDK